MATDAKETLIERLFGAGAHFGFGKSRRHPTVRPYLFGSKQGTDIFDLEKTSDLLLEAKAVLTEAGKKGEIVLFVGTKSEAANLVKQAAESIAMPYVVNRWIGGMLTNFSEMKKRMARLADLTAQGESGELERKYTKKERVVINRELEKLSYNFSGIKALERPPHHLLVVDPRHDAIAVREARELNIPIIAISSSDGNLTDVTYPVVANDALRSSVSFLLNELTTAYAEGQKEFDPASREVAARRRA
jgi:small subunit ribosomal protein S2